MKRLVVLVCAMSLVFGVVGIASANAIPTFAENFYGLSDDDDYIDLFEYGHPNSVTLHFDLTQPNPLGPPFPTTDEIGYDPLVGLQSAALDFTFSSEDKAHDKVQIWAQFLHGDELLRELTYDLGYQEPGHWEYWGPKWWQKYWVPGEKVREYAPLHIDLAEEGLLPFLQDGTLDTIVLATKELDFIVNDIRLDQASLVAEPVPEPTTMLLLGTGLVGLAGFRKRFRK